MTQITDQQAVTKKTAEFTVELTKGDALAKWYHKNEEIVQSEKYKVVIDGKIQRLFIYDVSLEDMGTYTCSVGNESCTAKLTVSG